MRVVFVVMGLCAAATAHAEAPGATVQCAISAVEAGKAPVVVSRPMVATRAGEPVKIEMTTGAGDGKPALTLRVEGVPRIAGDAVAFEGVASLSADDARRDDAALTGRAPSVELGVDGGIRYRVACTITPGAE